MFSATRLRDWILLLACNLIWGSQFVIVKLVQQQMGPVFATFFPITLAMLLLIPVVRRERSWAPGGGGRIPTRNILQFALLGVFGQVVAQLFITWGVRWSLASNAALIMLALPITTAVMAYFFLGERMTPVRWISFALALAGVLECSGADWNELNLVSVRFLLGNLMIFLSVNGSSFYNVPPVGEWNACHSYEDQLHGSCRDYFAIDGWAEYETTKGQWLWVSRDTALMTFNHPENLGLPRR
jgi:drug/metabolite transporter (DMT)-like permease